MWYTIFKFRKYLNCETLEMFKYMLGTSYFLMLWKIFELKKIFRNRREKICGTDEISPFVQMRNPRSTWPVIMCIFNLPPMVVPQLKESPSTSKCPTIIFSRSRGKGFNYTGETTKS
jgi:hypothetical protein